MIHIEVAGFSATVQDRGRFAQLRSGVPASGPADPVAFRAARSLAGNTDGDAAIEVFGLPFAFRCDDARIVAVTGRDVAVAVRDRVPSWTSVFVRAGDVVRLTGSARTRYAYVAVSGGVASDVVLGSRSVYPRAGLGRALRAGDALPLGPARRQAEDAGRHVSFEYAGDVAALQGPHHDRFDPSAVKRFFGSDFIVSQQSDRQGVRLEGADVAPRAGEILTCGVLSGAVQVPRGGHPIVLLADHQTTGGYPIVATVVESDLGRVAQRAPGEYLRFYRVEREEALERRRAVARSLSIA